MVDQERILELHRRGLSARMIAFEVGCATRTITRFRARHGLTVPQPANAARPACPERLERARVMLEDGASHLEVRETLGLHSATIRRHFPGTAWSRDQVNDARKMAQAFKALPSHLEMVA